MILFIITSLFMLIATPAHGAEEELSDHDQKTNTALNVVRHKPPAWLEKSRKQLILMLQETCNFPTVLGEIILDLMGDCGSGKLFPHVTIKNKHKYEGSEMHIVTLSDGRFAVTSCPNSDIIKVYDADGNLQHTLQHGSHMRCLSACSDGAGIAASSTDGGVNIWELNSTKKALLCSEFSHMLSKPGPSKYLVELSPHRLVVANYCALQLWDTENKTCSLESNFKNSIDTPLIKLSTGNIAVGYYNVSRNNENHQKINWALALWNTTTGALSYIPQAHDNIMSAITALPHGLFATGCPNRELGQKGVIKIWDIEQGKLLHTLVPYHGAPYAFCALPDGTLASGAYNAIDIWNPTTGTRIRTLHHNSIGSVQALLELPYGCLVAGGTGKNITVWDVVKGVCLQELTCSQEIKMLKTLSNGKLLSADRRGRIKIWDSAIDLAKFPSTSSQSHCRIS